jgi:vacuolar-type H+-ATPase catalytic subunit A/Vma1
VDARDERGHDESVTGAALAKISEGLFGEPVELTGLDVTFDLLIEARGIERLEPVAEFRELIGRQLGDGLFEVFDGHVKKYSMIRPQAERR